MSKHTFWSVLVMLLIVLALLVYGTLIVFNAGTCTMTMTIKHESYVQVRSYTYMISTIRMSVRLR